MYVQQRSSVDTCRYVSCDSGLEILEVENELSSDLTLERAYQDKRMVAACRSVDSFWRSAATYREMMAPLKALWS